MSGPERLAAILLAVLATAILLAFLRLLRGRSLPDRVVALDLMTTAAVGAAGLVSLASGQIVFLDVAIVIALISFVGTVAFAVYLERRRAAGDR